MIAGVAIQGAPGPAATALADYEFLARSRCTAVPDETLMVDMLPKFSSTCPGILSGLLDPTAALLAENAVDRAFIEWHQEEITEILMTFS